MKKTILLTTLISSLLLTSCNTGGEKKKDDGEAYEINEQYYSNVEKRAPFDLENELNFDETFDGGMKDSVWNCIEGSWHTDQLGGEHNGVQKRNLFYTTDKNNNNYLAIRAHGYYDQSCMATDVNLIKPEGGCIETINHLTPGRYEIKMAAMPREGGVSAMWTYCTTTGQEATSQNEIDIEIGGTTNGTQFEYEWCTSWTKQKTKQTDTIDVTNLLYLNNGRIHTYTFDWYTDYKGEGRVDWFIDGHFIDSLTGAVVPDHAMPLWVGVWFPPLWAGKAAFEQDYMLIDEIKFTAFDESEQYCDNCRSYVTYNPSLPSQTNIQTIDFDEITKNLNILSNGSMDNLAQAPKDGSYYGWETDSPDTYKGKLELSDTDKTEGYAAYKLTALDEENGGIYLGQGISNSFEGYKFHLSIDAKKCTEDAIGNIEVNYKKSEVTELKTETISIDTTVFKTYEYDITMPKGAKYLKIYVTAEKGSLLFDNAKLTRVID